MLLSHVSRGAFYRTRRSLTIRTQQGGQTSPVAVGHAASHPVVLGGRINLGREPSQFGLGLLRDTLHDESFAWWVRIVVDTALRDGRPFVNQFDGPYKYVGSRFTQQGFDLFEYDQGSSVTIPGMMPTSPEGATRSLV